MTDKAEQIIEWSKSVTNRTKNEYDPIARQLLAISYVAVLYNCWHETAFPQLRGLGLVASTKIEKIVEKLDPEFFDLLRQAHTKESKTKKFYISIEVSKIYKSKIFGTKNSIAGEFRKIDKFIPNVRDTASVHRHYTEKVIAIWHQAIGFPKDIVFKTDSGLKFNLIPADFEAIEQYIDGLDLAQSQIGSEPDKNRLLAA